MAGMGRVVMRVQLAAVIAAFAFAFVFVAGAAAFDAHGSAEQVYATGADPGATLTLLDPRGATVATEQATAEGGVLFRDVDPGSGYRVRSADGTTSDPLTVL